MIFYLNSRQNWSFVWELPSGFRPIHSIILRRFSLELRFKCLECKDHLCSPFLKAHAIPAEWCLESQLGHLLLQDHLRGTVLQESRPGVANCRENAWCEKGDSLRVAGMISYNSPSRVATKRFFSETMTVNTCQNWSHKGAGSPTLPQVGQTMGRVWSWVWSTPIPEDVTHVQSTENNQACEETKLCKRQLKELACLAWKWDLLRG